MAGARLDAMCTLKGCRGIDCAAGQLIDLAFPFSLYEQAPLVGAGIPVTGLALDRLYTDDVLRLASPLPPGWETLARGGTCADPSDCAMYSGGLRGVTDCGGLTDQATAASVRR